MNPFPGSITDDGQLLIDTYEVYNRSFFTNAAEYTSFLGHLPPVQRRQIGFISNAKSARLDFGNLINPENIVQDAAYIGKYAYGPYNFDGVQTVDGFDGRKAINPCDDSYNNKYWRTSQIRTDIQKKNTRISLVMKTPGTEASNYVRVSGQIYDLYRGGPSVSENYLGVEIRTDGAWSYYVGGFVSKRLFEGYSKKISGDQFYQNNYNSNTIFDGRWHIYTAELLASSGLFRVYADGVLLGSESYGAWVDGFYKPSIQFFCSGTNGAPTVLIDSVVVETFA